MPTAQSIMSGFQKATSLAQDKYGFVGFKAMDFVGQQVGVDYDALAVRRLDEVELQALEARLQDLIAQLSPEP